MERSALVSGFRQTEQTTIQSDFKPNIRLNICKECHRKRDYLNEFNECEKCEKCKGCTNNKRKVYLIEYQVCNTCYEEIEEMTPNGFKPNFRLEKCNGCNKRKDYLNEFLICNGCLSGNEVIDNFIRSTITNKTSEKFIFVSYDRFKNIELIAEGGFSKIYKAIWIDSSLN